MDRSHNQETHFGLLQSTGIYYERLFIIYILTENARYPHKYWNYHPDVSRQRLEMRFFILTLSLGMHFMVCALNANESL